MFFVRVRMDLNAYFPITTHCELSDCDEIVPLTYDNTLLIYQCLS